MSRRRIVKLGGSLLSMPSLVVAVQAWLARQPAAQNLVVVGGGETVEAMRQLARRFELDEPAMHWRCIRLLRATFEVTAELFPEWARIEDAASLHRLVDARPRHGVHLVAVDAFYSPETQREAGLPVGWATTTDSIAAYLARRTAADELVLLKSCSVPAADSVENLASKGIVDESLPAALPDRLPLRIEQLS